MSVLRGRGPNGSPQEITVDAAGALQATPTHANTAALIAHSAAAAGATGADQDNARARGIQLVVDVTAITGTGPSLTVVLEAKDAASGKYVALLTSAALTAVGTTLLTLYPGVAEAANVRASQVLPRTWRVRSTIAGTTPAVTATVGACLLV